MGWLSRRRERREAAKMAKRREQMPEVGEIIRFRTSIYRQTWDDLTVADVDYRNGLLAFVDDQNEKWYKFNADTMKRTHIKADGYVIPLSPVVLDELRAFVKASGGEQEAITLMRKIRSTWDEATGDMEGVS